MSNISIKLNLAGLIHGTRIEKGETGKQECIIIPIEKNNLYKGEKGLYIDLTAIEIKDRSKFSADQKDTHLVKQNMPKDVYEKMTDEQKKALPILGNAIVWGNNTNESSLAEPTSEEDPLPF